MNNTNETIGLRVLDVSPRHQSNNVNVHTNIFITFSHGHEPLAIGGRSLFVQKKTGWTIVHRAGQGISKLLDNE